MPQPPQSRRIYWFGVFELDLGAGELRKHGTRIRLQQKPFQALAILIARPGELVVRGEFQQPLWGETFVEYEDNLNHVIKRLRDTLGDTAETPRFIETAPGRGYRFVAPVEVLETPNAETFPAATRPAKQPALSKWAWGLAALAAVLAMAAIGVNFVGPSDEPSSPPVAAPVKPSVAVLPFTNLSADPREEYFADAMTDVLIGDLAKVGALRVISRTSVMPYKGSDKSLRQIGRDLNVSHVVEGSILHTGGQVRITAQLIEAATDEHVWTETYEKDRAGTIPLQAEIAGAIARAIQVELTPEEELRLAAARPVRPEVYETYLKARSFFDAGDTDKAIEYFQRTIEMDPDYAPAYSWLADSYIMSGWWTGSPEVTFSQAKVAALKARDLDDTLAEPHLLLGRIRAHYEWEWAEADQHFQRALALNPNHAGAYLAYSHYLLIVNRRKEALAMAERAMELDPLSPSTVGRVGESYHFVNDLDQAIENLRAALEMEPQGVLWHVNLGCLYTMKGEYDKAIASLERAIPLAGPNLGPQAVMAWSYAKAGDRAKARSILDDLDKKSPGGHASHYSRAYVYAALGDLDRAFAMLDQAVEERWPYVGSVTVLPPYDELRSDPRYQQFLKKIGLDKIHSQAIENDRGGSQPARVRVRPAAQ